MFFKSKNYLIIILGLLMGSLFYGCVEEPTIEAVKTPYAVLRVGNFSNNVSQFTIKIDGIPDLTMDSSQISGFYDILPGNKLVQVYAPNGDTLFYKELAFSSYQEMTLLFFGQFSKTDFLNNFGPYLLNEGTVFKSDAPEAGKTFLTVTHLITDDIMVTPNKAAQKGDINYVNPATGNKELLFLSLENKITVTKDDLEPGPHQIEFFKYGAKGNTVYLTTEQKDFAAGKRYLMILSGDANHVRSYIKEDDILPVRTK